MKSLKVGVNKGYEIKIQSGILHDCGIEIRNITAAKKALIVCDDNIKTLYLSTAENSLRKSGFETSAFTFKAGEKSKTFETVGKILEAASLSHLSRSDIIVALGGGVTGDMAGFAAAVYMRGIKYVQIPTSLLSMVDSSIGGKTGCDLPEGKNLAGCFWHPEIVLIDPDVLKTLPQKYYYDGLAEVIKAASIKSLSLFEELENKNPSDFLEGMIYENLDIKRIIVEADEKESGERRLLNFGHTIGHAVEKFYNFEGFTHGEAVAAGMVYMTKASENAGLTVKGTADRLINLLKKYNLPTDLSVDLKDLVPLMVNDKKRDGEKINLVLLKQIGESFVYNINIDALYGFLKDGKI